ncbi:AAA family ATPase [Candidatus Phytoplasma pyri]|uniref:AAA family ATPase n=1 Tax=Candidatus Phytoplasma pyri TaxID=47566 RepID=UPI003983714E
MPKKKSVSNEITPNEITPNKITPKSNLTIIKILIFVLFCFLISGILYLLLLETNIKDLDKKVTIAENDIINLKKTVTEIQKSNETNHNDNKILTNDSKNKKQVEIPKFNLSNSNKFPTFDDLIGFKEEKIALDGFVDYIRNRENYQNIGDVEPPLGILMYGVAGTGKTTLARALSKETKLPFFEISSSIFSQKYKGIAPQMVKDLFNEARNQAKQKGGCIIFLDECETIFTNISHLEAGNEIANVVNAFKTEITSMDNNLDKPVFIIGATNHINQLEEAIKSRFTYNVEVKPFNRQERQEFLEFLIKKRKNPYSDEAKKYLFEVINVVLDNFNGDNSFLKSNRTLENILKTTINVFAKNRKININPNPNNPNAKTYELRQQVEKADLKTAYSIVVSKDLSILDKIENSNTK